MNTLYESDTFAVVHLLPDAPQGADVPAGTAFVHTAALAHEALTDTTTGRVDYLAGPPKGATLIWEWNGRKVYVSHYPYEPGGPKDTLYISQLLDPEHVPWDELGEPTSDDGTYLRVGDDGTDLLAGWVIGSYLFLAKAQGIWVLRGRSQTSFDLDQVSGVYGALSQESVVAVEDAAIGADRNTVWVCDGQSVRQVGGHIRRSDGGAASPIPGLSEVSEAADDEALTALLAARLPAAAAAQARDWAERLRWTECTGLEAARRIADLAATLRDGALAEEIAAVQAAMETEFSDELWQRLRALRQERERLRGLDGEAR